MLIQLSSNSIGHYPFENSRRINHPHSLSNHSRSLESGRSTAKRDGLMVKISTGREIPAASSTAASLQIRFYRVWALGLGIAGEQEANLHFPKGWDGNSAWHK